MELLLPLRSLWPGGPGGDMCARGALLLQLGVLPALAPGLLLLHPRTRPRYAALRDGLLLWTWSCASLWVVVAQPRLRPGQAVGFLACLALALPMRWRRQAPLSLLAHSQLVLAGGMRAVFHSVVLPLSCSYCWEAHARRAFLAADCSHEL